MSLKRLTSLIPLTSIPSSTLERICSDFLGPGEGKVSDELISLKAHASSLAKQEPGLPRIVYNLYYTVLAYHGRNLVIARLQNGLNDLIAETWDKMLALSGGRKVPIHIPANMSEDIQSTVMGRSFIHDLPTTPPSLPLLLEMTKLPRFTLLRPPEAGSDGGFEVDPSSVQEFLHTVKPLVESIAFLLQVTGSGPLRMSEVVGDRYANGSTHRNLFISHGRVFLLRTGLKTSAAKGFRSHIVHFPPPKVAHLLVYYLSVVRPLEVFLTGQLGWVEEHAAYSQFIYVMKGSVLTPRAFSDIISTYTNRYFGCRLSGLDLRHVLKNVQETFLPAIIDPSVQKFGDSQAGHSTPTAQFVYGLRADHLPGREAASFVLAADWCRRLHKVLGVGPDPPSAPIPIIHAPADPTWWKPSEYIPSNSDPEDIVNSLHCRVTTTLTAAVGEVSRNCQNTLREATFESMATLWSGNGLPLPGHPPANVGPVCTSNILGIEPSTVSQRTKPLPTALC